MILNVSGRCDVVAFYTDWFMRRVKEGFLDVRNPFYPNQVSRIYFEDVDLIVFCTKNPIPILDRLKEIDKPILFHVTLTPYREDIEPGIMNSKKEIIKAIQELSKLLGSENVYVRYDPIFLSSEYTLAYHVKAFQRLCEQLDGYVKHFIISFIDEYKNVKQNENNLRRREFTKEDYKVIGESFFKEASKHGITVQTCFEKENLVEYGFLKRDCVDFNLAFQMTGKTRFKKWKARDCGCVEMVDIGVYNCCSHFCRYCYANYDEKKVLENRKNHDVNSTMLIGRLTEEDIVKIRKDK